MDKLSLRIKEALSKSRSLKEAAQWSSETQPNIYELDSFLRKSGYKLIDVTKYKKDQVPELLIVPIKSGYLYPDIVHSAAEHLFEVKVISYGLLGISDLEGIIRGYQNAIEVVKHLESLDLDDLEVEYEEPEDKE